ncbi:NAD-dependent 4,6-dehydratase LegB [Candidatus Margulisiibacteriota bacterium]
MNLQEVKVLVTGADGFIGSHLVEELVNQGLNVKAFVYYNSFNSCGWLDTLSPEIKEKIEIFSGDVRDPFGVKTAMEGCDVVFHLAALIAIPYSYHSPQSYVDTNIQGTLNIVQAARELKVKKVIHTSTSETYGTALTAPIDEGHPLQGQSPYSATKIGADQIALSFYRSFDLPVAVIRPFNTYGPRQSARAVIPTVITQIASGKKELKMGSITPTRDFNYVKDTVRGFIKVAEADSSIGEVINVGSGSEISIGDLVSKIAELMDSDVKIISDEERIRPEKSEVYRLLADLSKAREMIGYSPEYYLDDGLKETIEWFTDPENLKQYKTDIYNI